MAVLPPTEESTCASSVVGTCTQSSPRRTAAAQKPARSPTTPPPSAITTSPRSTFAAISASHTRSNMAMLFEPSPGGTLTWVAPEPAAAGAARLRPRRRRSERQRLDGRIGDDRGLRAGLERGDALPERAEEAAADDDVVGSCPER